MNIGPSLEGAYDLAMEQSLQGWGWGKLKRLAKKAGRGVRKGIKKTYRVSKKGVKLSLKPVKYAAKAGKFALRAMAKLAAKPIVYVFKKLAGRRAKYLSYTSRKSLRPTGSEKRQAAAWALGKVGRAGPVGKLGVRILKFVGASQSAGLLGGWTGELEGWSKTHKKDTAACGMTGAEIAAAAVTIVAAISGIMKSLNRPGEAPSNPVRAAKEEQPEEETQPVVEDTEEGEDSAGFFGVNRLRSIRKRKGKAMRRALLRRGVPMNRIRRLALRRAAKRGRIPAPPPPPRRRPPPPPKAPPPPRRRFLANFPPGERKG